MLRQSILLVAIFALSGCEYLKDNTEEIAMNNAKAIGAGCRQVGTPLVECYSSNGKVIKAGIFTGWKEMDQYMRENNIPTVNVNQPAPEKVAEKQPDKPANAVEEKRIVNPKVAAIEKMLDKKH